MLKAAEIRRCNERFANEHNAGLVCVFVGATSGIGAASLTSMVRMLDKSTFYIIGRSAGKFASQYKMLEKLNPSCKLVFLEAQISLLADVDAVCEQIAAAEQKVDLLYMSPGGIPFGGPRYTKEGLETSFAISFYSRMRLTMNLLPLLRQSPRPRVLSLLNAGKETAMFDDDIGLEKYWSAQSLISHTTTMMSLALEYLSKHDEHISFLHVYPGLVSTGIFTSVKAAESSGVVWRVMLSILCGVFSVVQMVFGITPEECGERQAYHLTSDKFGPGAWRIGRSSEVLTAYGGVLQKYRDAGWPEKVWGHTIAVFHKVSTTATDVSVPV